MQNLEIDLPGQRYPIRIGAGQRPDQLLRVLEALAVISSFTTSALSTELESRTHALPAGATVVVVAATSPLWGMPSPTRPSVWPPLRAPVR